MFSLTTQKKPETISRPPKYDSDDAFEQLADITIGAEDSDANTSAETQKPFGDATKKRKKAIDKAEETETGKVFHVENSVFSSGTGSVSKCYLTALTNLGDDASFE